MRVLLDQNKKQFSYECRMIYRDMFGYYNDDKKFIVNNFSMETGSDFTAYYNRLLWGNGTDIVIFYMDSIDIYSPITLIGCWILSQYIKKWKLKKGLLKCIGEK